MNKEGSCNCVCVQEHDRANFDRPLRSLHDVQSPPFGERSVRVHAANVLQHVPTGPADARTRVYRMNVRVNARVYVYVHVFTVGSFIKAELPEVRGLLSPGRHDDVYFHS